MKNKNIIALLFASLAFAGCEDMLNTAPQGGTVTADQKNEAVQKDPTKVAADLAAMNANMIGAFGVFPSAELHWDFGYASACIMMDLNCADMTTADIGYNHYSANCLYTDRVYNTYATEYMWSLFYNQIATANSVISAFGGSEEDLDAVAKQYLGQALAVRAFDYLNLAQLHQFTYLGNENKPCVPIIDEGTTADQASNNPRATVKAVYELIMNDLNRAVKYLDGFKRTDKGYVDQSVALGLRARTNLLMGQYTAAAEDAKNALDVSGAEPYTLEEVSKPGFRDAQAEKSVMWANIITPDNDIVKTGICNWPSMMCSFNTDGYVGVGCWKKISKNLYDLIPASDVRKGWWLNEEGVSPLVADEKKYADWREVASGDSEFGAYTNVKFGIDGDNLSTQTPAQDWFLMRAEEMILLRAEALAMDNKAGEAQTVLVDFMKLRDPSYTVSGDLVEAIWLQRRIELWGEGFAYFDIMRMKKPVERIVNGVTSHPDALRFNIPAEDPILLWLVPKSEIEANQGISEEDNNAKVNPPKA